MLVRLRIQLETLRGRLWLIPAVAAIAAAVAAWVLVTVDRALGTTGTGPFAFGGGPESARSILSTIAAAMLSFTGLVFSVTMLVLQLASSQLSPRVTRTFLRDRKNQFVLGIFVATFVYALLVLREVRSIEDGAFVPSVAVWWAFVLLLGSVAAFVYYIDHMAHAMRVSTIIASVAEETRAAIDRRYPEDHEDAPPVEAPIPLPSVTKTVASRDDPGVLQAVDIDRLEELAQEASVILELVAPIGESVPGHAPLVNVHGGGTVDDDAVREAISLGVERTMDQDPAFGFRQLVDVAVRALSPGINDPTTAHLVVDQLHDLLRRLAGRAMPTAERYAPDGVLRVIVPVPGWTDYLRLATDEIVSYGAESVQVMRGLRRMLDDLATVVSGERLSAVRRLLARLPADETIPFD